MRIVIWALTESIIIRYWKNWYIYWGRKYYLPQRKRRILKI